jgi:uncharacterized membrane protein YqjE
MANHTNNDTSDLGKAIQDIPETTSLLIREEIELAKAEMAEKASKLGKGGAAGGAGGIFALFGLIYLLNALSWLIWELIEGDVNSPWLGFFIVSVALFLLGAIAAFVASRFVKGGSPPTPKMAIEEGRLIKETVTSSHPATLQGPRDEVRR